MTSDQQGPDGPRSGTQAIDRALGLLQLFQHHGADHDLGITAIAAAAGLSVSTSHRLVKALCAAGLVAQDEATERYHLGAELIALGRRAEARLGLDRWHGLLEQLADETGESASLGTRVGNEVLIADHVPSAQPLRFDAGTGNRVPIHASAMGKVLLARSADPEREVAGLGPLARFTDRTLTDPAQLLEELATIRSRGWALNDGERDPGVRAIAVALPDGATRAPAAVAVQGPSVRLTDDSVESLASVVATAVRSAVTSTS
jgi:DNA-binding IclR family transcriptional regulator